ncbi:hypothetical protein P8C59_008589 [Phyllachora maydis]|uniref:Cyclin N-terminal domain-containing protein n=1 Tax=Phyllachora maydis TaxID=1825666 RepID=A0AAD9IB06_9PEZI|nr:hypothetical protein P8C59_008589 [Phyllachora maydis]
MAYSSLSNGDSVFWVESDEASRPRMDMRDAAKMLARSRQEMIGNELSRLASDEYLEDIMQHMRHMEDETLPDANLIDMQREIQWFMRPYLIDFLVEAHAAFYLLPETLFLTVNLVDRYCSKRVVYKQHYQLVGCAALLIAAKYGDKKDRVPHINELDGMCCGLYDAGMFTQMEMHVLNTLEWNIGHPTVDFFTQLLVAEERDSLEVEHMAAYICEIALYHRDFVSTKPSIMARSSLALARAILGQPEVHDGEWDHMENVTLLALTQHLHQPSIALSRKYSTSAIPTLLVTDLATLCPNKAQNGTCVDAKPNIDVIVLSFVHLFPAQADGQPARFDYCGSSATSGNGQDIGRVGI